MSDHDHNFWCGRCGPGQYARNILHGLGEICDKLYEIIALLTALVESQGD